MITATTYSNSTRTKNVLDAHIVRRSKSQDESFPLGHTYTTTSISILGQQYQLSVSTPHLEAEEDRI